MKYIAIKMRNKTFRIAESDIKKIHIQSNKNRPSLPTYDQENFKMYSPSLTEAEDFSFSEVRDEKFLSEWVSLSQFFDIYVLIFVQMSCIDISVK